MGHELEMFAQQVGDGIARHRGGRAIAVVEKLGMSPVKVMETVRTIRPIVRADGPDAFVIEVPMVVPAEFKVLGHTFKLKKMVESLRIGLVHHLESRGIVNPQVELVQEHS
jgi:hypothetical protein